MISPLRYFLKYESPELPDSNEFSFSFHNKGEPMAPHLEEESRALLADYLGKSSVFLEYGSGGSTFLALDSNVSEVHSVESDLGFMSSILDQIDSLGLKSKFYPYPCDIGPTGAWGTPLSRESSTRWMLYPFSVWWKLMLHGSSPDLILIDGRFRVSCFLASLWLSKEGTVILLDDYIGRPYYHVVERFISPLRMAGRMAVFKKPLGLGIRFLPYLMLHLVDFR